MVAGLHVYWVTACFNEAPALRGGNLGDGVITMPKLAASMRPPHCAGEIPSKFNNTPRVVSLQ